MTHSTYASSAPHFSQRPGGHHSVTPHFTDPNTWQSVDQDSLGHDSLNQDSLNQDSLGGWDLNEAEPQGAYDLIPAGTILRVRLNFLKPKDQDTLPPQWRDGYATKGHTTDSIYARCEYTVCEDGPYNGQKIWGLIGLYSSKSSKWQDMGKSFMRAIVESAHGLTSDDKSDKAQSLRRVKHYSQLQGLEFVVRVDVEEDKEKNQPRNVIKRVLTKGHKGYELHSGYRAGGIPTSSLSR